MTNQNNLTVWAGQEIPAPTPQLTLSLSQEQLGAHRQKIAFDVEVVLEGYWDSRPPANIKAGILADWADALEDWHHEQVVYALRKWRNENPSKKPNPGHILSILKAERGKAEAERAARAEPKQETQNPGPTQEERERMAAYVAAKGFPTLKRME